RSEAERTLNILIARDRAATARREFANLRDERPGVVAGNVRFDQLRKRTERREAEAEALIELVGGDDDETPESDADRQIESQLQAIKGEIKTGSTNQPQGGEIR